jgi:hypothetical protein
MTAPIPDLDDVNPPAELVALIAAEARGLLSALELPIADLQRWPLGPAAAAEVARIRGLLLSLQAAADALPDLDLGLPPGLEP